MWSRDGAFVYFIHTYETWHAEPSEIYRVAAGGGPVERVVGSVRRAVYPVPTLDGGLIYAGNPASLELGLWWKRPGNSVAQPLTTGFGEYTEPRLSADGRRLVATLVETRQSLATLPVGGGSAALRPFTDGYSGDLDPSVDPRSDRLVFSSSRLGHRNLWLARTDGTQAVPLTNDTAIDERPAFSPDGRQIAFVSDRGGRRGIWVIGADGGAPKFLTEASVLDTLTWSRDSARILFATPRGDVTKLATVAVDGGSVEPFPTPAAACAPAWSPAADVIAYLQPTFIPPSGPSSEPVSRLWLRFVDGQGRRLYPELADMQFNNGFVAWSADGRRLAAAFVPANGASSIWIVEPGARDPFKKLTDQPAAMRPRGLSWSRDGSGLVVALHQTTSDIVLFDVEMR